MQYLLNPDNQAEEFIDLHNCMGLKLKAKSVSIFERVPGRVCVFPLTQGTKMFGVSL